jgi:hypothetical protein
MSPGPSGRNRAEDRTFGSFTTTLARVSLVSLGDANRGFCALPGQRGRGEQTRRPAALTPPSGGPSFFTGAKSTHRWISAGILAACSAARTAPPD